MNPYNQPNNQQTPYGNTPYNPNQFGSQAPPFQMPQPFGSNVQNQPYGANNSLNRPNPIPQTQQFGASNNYNQVPPYQQAPYGASNNYSQQNQMPPFQQQQPPYGNNPSAPQMPPYQQQAPYGNNPQFNNPSQPFNNQFNERPREGMMPPSMGGFQQQQHPNLIFQKHEINPQMVQKLQQLNAFKIVFIFDDSGSMNSINQDSNNMSTRWDELLQFANTSIEIASIFNHQGSDVHFLNRPPIRNVRDQSQLAHYFRDKPQGVTPLTRTIQTVINENQPNVLNGKNLLLIIATDGEPTDMNGYANIPEFKQCLFNRPPNVFTTIVACTSDQQSVGYLNGLDKEIPRLDVVDDYRSEFNEIKRAKGPQFPFSFGDYVAKSFLGSIDPEMDRIDE